MPIALLSGNAGLGLEWMPVAAIVLPLVVVTVLAVMSTRRI